MNAPHLKHVLGSPMLEGLQASEIEELYRFLEFKKFIAGATIFLEGMDGEYMYLLLRGTVKVSRMAREGNEKILVVLGPEDMFGEMAVFEPLPREATARVVEEAQLAILSRDKFEELGQTMPRLALKLTMNIVRVLARRVREAGDEYREIAEWVNANT